MADWAWPHAPASNYARLLLIGGPFDGEEAAFAPPDLTVPAQIIWSGWTRQGFTAYVYERTGETAPDEGRTAALIYRATGRRLAPGDIPPLMAQQAEMWADGAEMIRRAFDVPADLIWPGL